MPDTPTQRGSQPTERRLHKRIQPSGLVYLDIGAENGGIVLDLNEEGAGVQAVAPLAALSDISIRFQLPDSRQRLHAEAQVAWVSESRRRVGLHFTAAPEEVRACIREWLQSQSAAPHETQLEADVPGLPQSETAHPAEIAKEESPALLREIGLNPKAPETPAATEMPVHAPPNTALVAREDTSGASLRELLKEIALAKASDQAQRAPANRHDDRVSPGDGEQTSVDRGVLEPSRARAERSSVIHWPANAVAADAHAEAMPVKGAAIAVPKPPVGAPVEEQRRRPSDPAPAHAGKWWKLAIAVVILLAASFETGRWLGNIGAPAAPAVASNVAQQIEAREKSSPASATTGRHRNMDSRGRPGGHVVTAVPSQPPTTSGPILPAAAQPSSPPSPPTLPDSLPTIDAPAAAPARPPASDARSSAPAPAGPVIDGRALTATDRFNPAHLLYRFDPDYPAEAKQENVEGTVMLRIEIDTSGTVDRVQVLSGPPLLVPSAVSAVKNWRYLPALLNGDPVKSEQYVSVDFRLPASDQ